MLRVDLFQKADFIETAIFCQELILRQLSREHSENINSIHRRVRGVRRDNWFL